MSCIEAPELAERSPGILVGIPSRKPVILVGAPSGAGKTVLSLRIIEGKEPFFAELCGCDLNDAIRYDIARRDADLPRDKVVIIEVATHKPKNLVRGKEWRKILEIVRESEKVVFINLDIGRAALALQYFLRIFTQPARHSLFRRIIQVSKYRNTLLYLLSGQISRARVFWEDFGARMACEMPSRFVVVRANRVGDGYSYHLAKAVDANDALELATPSQSTAGRAGRTHR